MSIEQNFNFFNGKIDGDFLQKHTTALTRIEMMQTSAAQRRAAEYTLNLLKQCNIPNAEIIDFPADGKTVYLDNRMPMGWNASVGKLSFLHPERFKNFPNSPDGIIADYQRHPFHLIYGSTATPEGGLITSIVTEDQMLAGTDVTGKLVMLNPLTAPRPQALKTVLDLGGIGIVADFLTGRYRTPDCIQWVVACTECGDWHITGEDRDFIGFSISPRTGDALRNTIKQRGSCMVRVECDGRRSDQETISMVTALIPGKSKREVWIMAHLYEPMIDDDSCGVTAGIEIAKQIMNLPQTEYSLRLVFAKEFYGFAAYAAYRGTTLHEQVAGAANLDSICTTISNSEQDLILNTSGNPDFAGNDILREAMQSKQLCEICRLQDAGAEFHDDQFLSDASIGVPTVWIRAHKPNGCWHNSFQCDPANIHWDAFTRNVTFAAAFFLTLLNRKDISHARFKVSVPAEKTRSPWRDYADQMVLKRAVPGFPYSLDKVPVQERISLPDGTIYGHFAHILSHMDGVKTLEELIRIAEAERKSPLKESAVKKIIDAINFLADYGYLTPVKRPEITKEDIHNALKELGVDNDDILLVHASVSKCGYVKGGAVTIIDAIRETAGTCLFTTFTRPYIYLGGVNTSWTFRPHDHNDPYQVWTGAVGTAVLAKYPDAVRSRHVTHSWAGFGKKIHECVDAHEPYSPPTGEGSPLEKAMELGGKILFFGTTLAPSTFLHYLETKIDHPCLDTAICRVKMDDGSLKTVAIEKHLPGDRDFYGLDAEQRKFYRKAVEAGLKIKRVKLGMDELILLDAQELYRIGMDLLAKDPDLLMCDDPQCEFCQTYRVVKK